MITHPSQLLAAGQGALQQGDKDTARILLARLVEQEPGSEAGWLWLSGAVDSPAEQRKCLEQVLAINPANPAAQHGLIHLGPPAAEAAPNRMPCPGCGQLNKGARKFCVQCGQALTIAPQMPADLSRATPSNNAIPESIDCPACRELNPAGRKFCRMCGQAFTPTGQARSGQGAARTLVAPPIRPPTPTLMIAAEPSYDRSPTRPLQLEMVPAAPRHYVLADARGRPLAAQTGAGGLSAATLGMAGALVLGLGTLTPIISLPFLGSITYFNNGHGDGVIVLMRAGLSLLVTMARRYRLLWLTGLAALGLISFTLSNFIRGMGLLQTVARTDGSGTLGQDLASVFTQSIQLQWGWGVMLIGVGLLLAAAWRGHRR